MRLAKLVGRAQVPNLYRGQVCLTDPSSAWWNNFSVGDTWSATVGAQGSSFPSKIV
jgi:hypothetical protein